MISLGISLFQHEKANTSFACMFSGDSALLAALKVHVCVQKEKIKEQDVLSRARECSMQLGTPNCNVDLMRPDGATQTWFIALRREFVVSCSFILIML